jgi:hypothetical protein
MCIGLSAFRNVKNKARVMTAGQARLGALALLVLLTTDWVWKFIAATPRIVRP